MAHGFLSYEEVSGDRFWQNAKWLGKQLDKIRKAKIWPLSDKKIVNAHVSELQNLLVSGQQKKMAATPQTRMLGAGAGGLATKSGGLVEKNPTNIDVKTGERPPSGPRLPAGGGPSKGGGFTDIPGIASSGLNAESFFQKAQTGVGASGEYLTKAQRIADFRKSQEMRSASAGSPPITGDSGVDIVAAVNRNTQIILSLVDAVKEQTKTQVQLSEKESQNTEKLMLRAAARQEESDLEKGKDLSGFLTPERFKKKEKNTGGSGGGDDSLLDFLDVGLDLLDIGGGRRGRGGRGSRVTTGRGGKGAGKGGGIARGLGKASKGGGLARGAAGLGKGLMRNAGPLALLGGAFEFSGRKAEGQSNLQAGVGTAASVAGGLAGAAKGAAMGAALGSVVPGLGTAVGGVLGGLIGGFGGSALAGGAADLATGAFANGGLISKPTLSLMGEGNKAEGVFPLEGSRGKKTFRMFGEGVFQAQKDNDADFAKLQAKGFKQYFETEGGGKKLGESLKDFFGTLAGGIASLFGGAANAGTLDGAADYLNTGGGGAPGAQSAGEAGLLKALRFAEGTEKSYGTIFGGNVVKELEQGELTVQEVINMADTGKLPQRLGGGAVPGYGKGSKATGAYQFMPFTLESLIKDGTLKPNEKFTNATQDKAALALARRRGVTSQMLNTEGFSQKVSTMLAPEWASLPTASGKSYYGQPVKSLSSLQSKFQAGKTAFSTQPLGGGGGNASIANAAQSLKGMDTSGGPGGGSVSCVYAVNKVFNKAGVKPPWGGAQSTDAVINGARRAGWQQVGFGDAKPGDVWVYDANDGRTGHVGIMMPNGRVLSNSSSNKKFTWEADKAELMQRYPKNGMTPPGGIFFRAPGSGTIANPPGTGATPSTAATPRTSPRASTRSSPGSLQASAASPNTGTSMMAASQQVAMGTMGLTTQGGGATIINNYYGGGQSGGVNPNGVVAGIGMEQTGTAAFQPLKIMALT